MSAKDVRFDAAVRERMNLPKGDGRNPHAASTPLQVAMQQEAKENAVGSSEADRAPNRPKK
jgi:hypothetical protein